MSRHVQGYFSFLASMGCRVLGVACAMLPRRYWPVLDAAFPVSESAALAGILTVLAAAAIGIPGFIHHAQGESDAHTEAVASVLTITTAAENRRLLAGANGLALFTFLLLTPAGWATMYLGITGGVRAAGAWFDDPHGDFLLTAIDAVVVRNRRDRNARSARSAREALEGPEVPDRVVSGAQAGLTDAQFVIVSSRRKPGWDAGTVVLTDGPSYRVGTIVERTIHGRLRTLYPLTEHKDFEAFRRTVRYDMPRN
jgi:hypothetical protein